MQISQAMFKVISRNKTFSLTIFCIILVTSLSCGEKSSSETSVKVTTGSSPNAQSSDGKRKICKQQQVLKVLDDGKSVISRLKNEKSLVKWNISQPELIKSFDTPIRPEMFSPDGSLLLRTLTKSKYQVLRFDNKSTHSKANITLNAYEQPRPLVSFTKKSNYLTFLYRPFTRELKKTILVYSFKANKYVFDYSAKNIYFANIGLDEKFIYIVEYDGKRKYLKKIDILSNQLVFKKELSIYSNYTATVITKDVYLIKEEFEYIAYSLEDGRELYSIEARSIYDIDSKGQFGIIVDSWSEYKIFDFTHGHEIKSNKKNKKILLPSCQLLSKPLQISCLGNSKSGKIIRINLESNEESNFCH